MKQPLKSRFANLELVTIAILLLGGTGVRPWIDSSAEV